MFCHIHETAAAHTFGDLTRSAWYKNSSAPVHRASVGPAQLLKIRKTSRFVPEVRRRAAGVQKVCSMATAQLAWEVSATPYT